MDWPLSRDEKTRQLLHLYDQDARISDSMISSGEAALTQLKAELEAFRESSRAASTKSPGESFEDDQRLWQAVETAAAVLRAVVVVPKEQEEQVSDDDCDGTQGLRRARSEGAMRGTLATSALKPAISRTPRTSLTGKPRRVSFSAADPKAKVLDEQPIRATSIRACDAESMPCNFPNDEPQEPEPEDEEPPLQVEAVSPQAQPQKPAPVLDWGLSELCAPIGTSKVGLHFKDLPPEPLVVRKITHGSWAESQNIRIGDVVLAVNGRRSEVLTAEQFIRFMMARPLRLIVERLPPERATNAQGGASPRSGAEVGANQLFPSPTPACGYFWRPR